MLLRILFLILISSQVFAVTKVKDLKIGVDGVPTELGTSDYLGIKGLAFDNSDTTLIDVGSSRVQVTHNGVTAPVCFQSPTTFTTASIPFSDSSGRLTQDNANFNYDDSNNILNVPGVQNDATTSNDFTLRAHSGTFAATDTGRIRLKERMVFNEAFSVGATFVGYLVDFSPTITSTTALTAMYGMRGAPTIRYNTAQILSAAPAFLANPIYQPTTSVTDQGFFSGFYSNPIYKPDFNSAGLATASNLWGYISSPMTARANAGTAVVTRMSPFKSYGNEFLNYDIETGTTVTTLAHFDIVEPTSRGAVTNQTGLYLPAMTLGTVHGVESLISANASRWFLYSSGSAVSNLTGGLRIGDTTQTTEKLEVLGNILIDNGGTAGTLKFREPSGSGSNFTAFKAQTQTGDVTYTLPAADGSSGNVLSTDGSGTLSWASAGASTVLNAFKTGDTSRTSATGTTLSADPDLSISTTWATNSTYSVEGMIFMSEANATPDLDFQFNGPTVNFVSIGGLAMRTGSTSVVTTTTDTAFATGGTAGTTIDMNLTTRHYMIIHGSFQTTGTPGSNPFSFEWGQNVSNAANVTVLAGSWIRLTKLN